jgi:hypothetical protein
VKAVLFIPVLALAIVAAAGCEPYRIEYHKRPAYYHKVAEEPLPDEVVLDDGTKIVYETRGQNAPRSGGKKGDERRFMAREEMEDGSVVLRAIMPEHVLGNLLHCLRNREYELIWDQMLSDQIKLVYEGEGKTKEDFVAWCSKHRIEIAKTTNRMLLGLATGDTVVEPMKNGMIECRFWPQVATQFKFTSIVITNNEFELGLKLVLVR